LNLFTESTSGKNPHCQSFFRSCVC